MRNIAEIPELIQRPADEGKAVVMISSCLPEIMAPSDRILVSRQGISGRGVFRAGSDRGENHVRGGALGREIINAPIGLTARVHFVPDSQRIVASQRNYAMCHKRSLGFRGHCVARPRGLPPAK